MGKMTIQGLKATAMIVGQTAKTVVLSGAQIAAGAASKVFALGVRLVNAAMRANPIGIVITIITALIAIIVVAYKKNETFRKIVDNAWRGIQAVIKWAWNNVILPIFKLVVNYFKTLGQAAVWLYQKAIKPAWDWIAKGIRTNWLVIKLVFDTLKNVILHTIPNAFKTGVAAIGRFWDNVKNIAKKPVSFVVNTVYNKGIRGVWNWVASKVGLGQLPAIQGFAKGGILPGFSRKDNQIIAARSGEGILVPEAVKELGSDFIHHANKKGGLSAIANLLGFAGDPGALRIPGFAGGGIVGAVTGFLGKAKDFFVNGFMKAARAAMSPIVRTMKATIGGTGFGGLVSAAIERVTNGILSKFTGYENELGGGGGMKAVHAARSQIGRPYSWGGGGPHGPSYGIERGAHTYGFDCSGLTEYAWFQALHKSIGGTTYEQKRILKPISRPRPGAVGQPHPGHTYLATERGTIIEAPYTGARVREVPMRATPWWGWPPWSFDNGGVWEPGTFGFNGTREPEAVFTGKQMKSMGATPEITVIVNVDPVTGKKTYEGLKEYKTRNGGRKLGLD